MESCHNLRELLAYKREGSIKGYSRDNKSPDCTTFFFI